MGSQFFLLSSEKAMLLPISASHYRAEFEISEPPVELDLKSETAEESEPISAHGAP